MNESADELYALIRQGHKIEAIKRLRQLSGVDLKAAKEAVERMDTQQSAQQVLQQLSTRRYAPRAVAGAALPPEVVALARDGQRLQAIKRLRELQGGGLKDAKLAIDAAVPPPPTRAVARALRVIVALVLLVLGYLLLR